jgi:transposase
MLRVIDRSDYASIKDRMRAVALRRTGKTLSTIAGMLGRSLSFVKTWNDRFIAEGFDGLRSRPAVRSKTKLSETEEKELCQILKTRLSSGDGREAIQRVAQVSELAGVRQFERRSAMKSEG